MTSKVFVLAGMISFVGLLPLRVAGQEVQNPRSKDQSLGSAASDEIKAKTWKTLDELSAEEKAMLDLRADTPRDPQIPYLPAEKFPFAAPYTAEEMGLRAMEFPHSPKLDLFAYSPALRRVRRQPQPRREDRLPNSASTFDDLIGRDAWEFKWRILGTDVLHHTARFPVTRQTAVLTDEKGGYIDVPASEIKLMGKDYPLYTVDGGVKCFVVEAVPKQEWLKDYYMSKLIY